MIFENVKDGERREEEKEFCFPLFNFALLFFLIKKIILFPFILKNN